MAGQQSLRRLAGTSLAALALVSVAFGCGPARNPSATIEPEPGTEAGAEPTLLDEPEPEPPPPPQCLARTPRGGPSLIPDGAAWLVHVAPRELLSSQAWASLMQGRPMPGQLSDLEDAFARCGVSLNQVDHILFGFDPDTDDGTLVATGPRLGQPEVATCLATSIEWLSNSLEPNAQPVAETAADDPQVRVFDIADDRVYLFHPDMVVLTSGSERAEVEALSRCEGYPAIDHGLGELVRRIDTQAPVWFAGRLTPEMATSMESSLSLDPGTMRDVILSARVESGLAVQARLGASSPSGALAVEAAIGNLMPMLQTLGPAELQQAVQRIEFETLGAELMIQASLTHSELGHLSAMF